MKQIVLGSLVWALSTACASATTMTFSFSQAGFTGGGIVTGVFIGEDLNGDGQLGSFLGEITDASMQFSGNGTVTQFDLTFSELFGLVYDLDGGAARRWAQRRHRRD